MTSIHRWVSLGGLGFDTIALVPWNLTLSHDTCMKLYADFVTNCFLFCPLRRTQLYKNGVTNVVIFAVPLSQPLKIIHFHLTSIVRAFEAAF